MLLSVVECLDCHKKTARSIQFSKDGTPFWVCPHCGAVHEDRSWYRLIGEAKAGAIIREMKLRGLFVFDTGTEIIGIDNSTGNAWTEEFPDMIECLLWLAGEKEVSE